MNDNAAKRTTISLEPDLYRAIRLKAARTNRSFSEIVNDAVRMALSEDDEDLAAFGTRGAESLLSYDALLEDLKAHGKS